MVTVKPVGVVMSVYGLDYIERLVEEEVRQLMSNARSIGNGLFVIEEPPSSPTPSLLTARCPVEALLKLRVGVVATGETVRWVALGNVYHRLYEEWFRRANPGATVISELGLELSNGLRGRMDIFYEENGRVGVVELKASYRDYWEPGFIGRVKKQLAAYYHLLSQAGYDVSEAYVVTMMRVYPVTIGELRQLAPKAVEELNAMASMEMPSKPPKPELCIKCRLKPICPAYQASMTLILPSNQPQAPGGP